MKDSKKTAILIAIFALGTAIILVADYFLKGWASTLAVSCCIAAVLIGTNYLKDEEQRRAEAEYEAAYKGDSEYWISGKSRTWILWGSSLFIILGGFYLCDRFQISSIPVIILAYMINALLCIKKGDRLKNVVSLFAFPVALMVIYIGVLLVI